MTGSRRPMSPATALSSSRWLNASWIASRNKLMICSCRLASTRSDLTTVICARGWTGRWLLRTSAIRRTSTFLSFMIFPSCPRSCTNRNAFFRFPGNPPDLPPASAFGPRISRQISRYDCGHSAWYQPPCPAASVRLAPSWGVSGAFCTRCWNTRAQAREQNRWLAIAAARRLNDCPHCWHVPATSGAAGRFAKWARKPRRVSTASSTALIPPAPPRRAWSAPLIQLLRRDRRVRATGLVGTPPPAPLAAGAACAHPRRRPAPRVDPPGLVNSLPQRITADTLAPLLHCLTNLAPHYAERVSPLPAPSAQADADTRLSH